MPQIDKEQSPKIEGGKSARKSKDVGDGSKQPLSFHLFQNNPEASKQTQLQPHESCTASAIDENDKEMEENILQEKDCEDSSSSDDGVRRGLVRVWKLNSNANN